MIACNLAAAALHWYADAGRYFGRRRAWRVARADRLAGLARLAWDRGR